MNFVLIAAALTLAVVLYTLFVRSQDLPEAAPVNPLQHLEARKAAIYENLRDLQFEYRLGKLSDVDYQTTKKDLQKELATVLEEVDRLRAQIQSGKPPAPAKAAASPAAVHTTAKARENFVCDSCGASFAQELKFCGECGKSMKVAK